MWKANSIAIWARARSSSVIDPLRSPGSFSQCIPSTPPTVTCALLVLPAWLVYTVASPFLVAIGWGTILAAVTFPVYDRLRRKPGRRQGLAEWSRTQITAAGGFRTTVPERLKKVIGAGSS
jgi:hypothetical protein